MRRDPESLNVTFAVTDGKGTFEIHYQGFFPICSAKGRAWWPTVPW